MFVSLEVCQTSRSALAYQLERTYFGIRHSFLRSLVAQHPCWTEACFLPCTRLPDIVYQSLANYLLCTKAIRCDGAAELETSDGFQVWCRKHQVVFHPVSPYQHTIQGHIEHLAPCTRRDTSSLLQAFSPPSLKGCSSGGYFLFPPLLVLFLSHTLCTLVNIFSSGYFIPLCLCIHSLRVFAITQCFSCLSWGVYRESLGTHFSFYK